MVKKQDLSQEEQEAQQVLCRESICTAAKLSSTDIATIHIIPTVVERRHPPKNLKGLRELIRDSGLTFDPRITRTAPKRFLGKGYPSDVVNFHLLRFKGKVGQEKALRAFEKMGLCPGEDFHLLDFRNKNPLISQRVLALGSVWQPGGEGGPCFVACLYGESPAANPQLSLKNINEQYPPDHWFLAVPPP